MQQVMGWGFDQWAIAAARLGRPREVSYEDALRLKRRWQQLHTSEPGDVPLLGIRVPRDEHFAAELFAQHGLMMDRQRRGLPPPTHHAMSHRHKPAM